MNDFVIGKSIMAKVVNAINCFNMLFQALLQS